MKTITSLMIATVASSAFAQGTVDFRNTASTLISADGVPMPVSGTRQFIFALFLAPSTTVNASGQSTTFVDPTFQFVAAYNTNTSSSPGRLNNRIGLIVGESQGYLPGSTVDFIVRGWSADAGLTWSEALANWNDGEPLVPMFIGASTVGNNLFLSGGQLPTTAVFGFGTSQVLGFEMPFIPEPSTMALAFLGGLTLFVGIRHPERQAR